MKETSSGAKHSLTARLFSVSKPSLAGRTKNICRRVLLLGVAGMMLGAVTGWVEERVKAQIQGPPPIQNLGVQSDDLETQLQMKELETAQLKRSPLADEHLRELGVKARQQGEVPVIIRLKAAYQPEGNLRRPLEIQAQRAMIQRARQSLLLEMNGYDPDSLKDFKYLPYLAVSLTPAGIESIRNSNQLIDLEEDILLAPALSRSVPTIGANKAWESGYTGAGQTVAVIDTGIDKSHPALTGKVVSEGCFSTNYRILGASSICPGMASSTTVVDSGVNCNLPVNECKHGTLVGGVIAGNSATISGVAKDATLISLNVYSRFENVEICGDTRPCVMSFLSDQVRAMERIYDIRNQYNIAAVNFSISGRKYTGACDSESSLLSDSIKQLAVLGIPTITPTGNNGYTDATGMPACMRWSISVGATEVDQTGQERIFALSNSAPFIHLLAPGGGITSSVPGGGVESWTGTSIAAPHVSAAWALLKQRLPTATIDTALRALAETGVRITDNRNGLVKPRIQLDQAMRALSDKAPEIEGYSFSPNTLMDRDPFRMTITGNKFEFNATRLYFCMVGTPTCVEHPTTKVKVMAPTMIDADSVALSSGTWHLYLETTGGASGRSKPFSVIAPPPPPSIESYSWAPVNPRANQTFSGSITGNGFSVDGTKVYFCLAESSICTLLPNTNVIVSSTTRLTISGVTLNAGTWQVYIQTAQGASSRSLPFKIDPAILAPTITSFAWNPPNPGENQSFGGVLTGSNFIDKETKVFFCISTLTTCSVLPDSDVTVNSSSSLTVSNVLLRAGTWQTYVQTPGGASPRSASFTIQAQQLQPSIATFIWNPVRPTENQPFSGSISGSNFVEGGTLVYFCEAGTTRCTPVAAASIKVESLTRLTVSNITLRSGAWECYVTTPAGASPRSTSFEVVAASQIPTISNVTLSAARPTAFQPFSAVVSGANFVPGNTRVFFCPENSQNCQQQASGVNAVSSSSVNISNITLASGTWQLYLQTSAGNSNRSTPFTVDAVLLPPTIVGYTLNPTNPRTNEQFTATLTGTNFVPGNTQVFVCVGGTTNCAPVADGNYSITSVTSLTMTNIRLDSGTWQFQVQTAGGISGRSLPFTIQTPIATPTIATQTWNPQVLVANQAASVTISGAGFAPSGTQAFICVAGTETCFAHPVDQTVVNGPTSLTLNGVFLLAGSWEMYVQTPAGRSERTAAFTVRGANQLVPTITAYAWSPINPTTGVAFTGTITGTNFVTNATQVFFCVNGTSSCFQQPLENVRVLNSTTINLVSTFLMTGIWNFYVQTSAGTSARSTTFTVGRGDQAVPTLSSFVPTPSTLVGGQLFSAVITGTNFVAGATQVLFCAAEGIACTEALPSSINVVSQSSLQLANIALGAGNWQVVVRTQAGSSGRSSVFTVGPQLTLPIVNGYTWNPAPSSNQPFSGTIAGNHFDPNGTQLFFCLASGACSQVPAANFRVTSTSSISIINLTLTTGTWNFYVVTAAGRSGNSTPFSVTVLSQFLPTVTTFSWRSSALVANQGFSGIVNGTNFVTGATQVFFCNEATGVCTRLNSDNIRVTSPTSMTLNNVVLTGGNWTFYVQTTIGGSNRSSSFNVTAPSSPLPTIGEFKWSTEVPGSNAPFGGTITGTNFVAGGTLIFFCANGSISCTPLTPGQIQVVSPTSITISNVALPTGSWQFYIQTAAGNSSRSGTFTIFSITGEPIQPTLTSVAWTPLVPLSTSFFSGSVRGTNFVKNLTSVYACTFPSNNCTQIPNDSVVFATVNTLTLINVRLAKGTWHIYVETPSGASNRSRTFNVL